MKKFNKYLLSGGVLSIFGIALILLFILTPSVLADNNKEIQVTMKGNVQEAIEQADSGDIIKLKEGSYGDEYSPIKINKAITIEGQDTSTRNGTSINSNIIIDGTTKDDKVILKNFHTKPTPPSKETIYIEIKSPVTLEIDNVHIWQIYNSDTKKNEAHCLKVDSNANETTINIINDSWLVGWYDSIILESSNTSVTVDNSQIEGQLAFNLKNGHDNHITIQNNSIIKGRANFFNSVESIAIVNQQNLNMEVHDSDIVGNLPSINVKDKETHIFSFDGEEKSNNVRISIDGKSTIEDKSKVVGSSIINFGNSNTDDNSNIIKIAGTVKYIMADDIELGPKTKYNEDDNGHYVVVGIHDRQKNATIKAYDKEKAISDLNISKKDTTEVQEDDGSLWRFKGWYTDENYQTEYASGNYETPPKENIDIYGKYARLYKVKIGEETYKIEEGKKLSESNERQEIKAALEKLKEGRKTFKHYANQEDPFTSIGDVEDIMDLAITKDITIIAEHTLTVTIQGSDFSEEIDENTTYENFKETYKEKINQAVAKDNKKFKGFKNTPETFTENIELEPEYTVTVTIKEIDFSQEVDENTTYEDFFAKYGEVIQSAFKEKNKTFKSFSNKPESKFTEDIELEAKCSVIVTIKGTNFLQEVDENTTYEKFKEIYGEEINKAVTKNNKTFKDFKSNPDVFTENIELIPEYIVTITIKEIDFSQEVDENTTYEDFFAKYGEVIQSAFKEKNKIFKSFSNKPESKFTEDIELEAKCSVIVTIKGTNFSQEVDENTTYESFKANYKSKINLFVTKAKKNFKDFENHPNVFTENIELVPKYTVTVAIQDSNFSQEIDENTAYKSFNSIYEKEIEKAVAKEGKTYVDFKNKPEKFTEHITLVPKYTVKVTIKKQDGSTEQFILDEGTSLKNLKEQDQKKLEAIKKVSEYIFTGFFEENTDKRINETDIITKHITLVAQYEKKVPNVLYKTHVETYGWQDYIKNGITSGTVGKAKRLEAIRIKIENTDYSGTVSYQAHVENIGWQNYAENDDISGTTGQSKRLEAIRIKLTGDLAEHYDIYYRVHIAYIGWLDWAKNGEVAGTTGLSKRLEAIEIQLVQKNGAAPGSTIKPAIESFINYRSHLQNYGWQGYVTDSSTSGTVNQSRRLEAIQIKLVNPNYQGSVLYQAHVENIGWQNYVENNQVAGITGKSKRLEAIRIKLSGEMAEHYDIYYRVHVQNYGWLDWAKNGESAGTTGLSKRLEAIEIKLVEKNKAAPGSTKRPFISNEKE